MNQSVIMSVRSKPSPYYKFTINNGKRYKLDVRHRNTKPIQKVSIICLVEIYKDSSNSQKQKILKVNIMSINVYRVE